MEPATRTAVPDSPDHVAFKARFLALLRLIESGDVPLVAVGATWREVHAGDATFRALGWTIVIFNDADDYDYIDSVVTPDGRKWTFDDLLALGLDRPPHEDEGLFVRRLQDAPAERR